MEVGFVFTNYNNSRYTRDAVESLRAANDSLHARIVIVDNASGSEDRVELQRLASSWDRVHVIESSINVGYFPGLNLGIRFLRCRNPEIQVHVIGNNDLTFGKDFIANIERHRSVLKRWAVVAPDIVTVDGVHQNPHVFHPIQATRRLAWDLLYSTYPIGLAVSAFARLTRRWTVRHENSPESELYQRSGPVEQGYGACYLIGDAFFRHFEALCAPTFLMQEEFFLAEQLATIGQKTWYDPRFRVVHHTHASTGKLPQRRRWEIARGAHRIYKKYLRMSPSERADFIHQWSRPPPDPVAAEARGA